MICQCCEPHVLIKGQDMVKDDALHLQATLLFEPTRV
jgi:hypothetical protein